MSYARIHGDSIRFFVDAMNWMFSRGLSRSGEWTDRNTGAWGYNTNYDKYSLIDMDPLNPCSFNTSIATTAHVMHQMDFQVTASIPMNFLAIMNHNAASAQVGFRLAYSTGTISSVGNGTTVGVAATAPIVVLNGTINPDAGATINEDITTGETDWTVTDGSKFTVGELIRAVNTDLDLVEVVKVTNVAANVLTVTRAQQGTTAIIFSTSQNTLARYNVIVPDADGDTIITFPEIDDKRYWAVETIPSDGVMSGTDLQVGAYLVGNYYDMTVAPNLSVKHSFTSDGVKERLTPSGKSLTFAHHLTAGDDAANSAYSPFRRQTYFRRLPGRESWDLNWQGMPDTDIYPSDLQDASPGVFLTDVIGKVGINFLPFIFCINNASTDEGDFLWAKFGQKDFSTSQKAWQWVGFPLKITQQF